MWLNKTYIKRLRNNFFTLQFAFLKNLIKRFKPFNGVLGNTV